MAGMGPEEIDIAQVQDTESGAEIMHISENGSCKDGVFSFWSVIFRQMVNFL
jgi:hypothetical protein